MTAKQRPTTTASGAHGPASLEAPPVLYCVKPVIDGDAEATAMATGWTDPVAAIFSAPLVCVASSAAMGTRVTYCSTVETLCGAVVLENGRVELPKVVEFGAAVDKAGTVIVELIVVVVVRVIVLVLRASVLYSTWTVV